MYKASWTCICWGKGQYSSFYSKPEIYNILRANWFNERKAYRSLVHIKVEFFDDN